MSRLNRRINPENTPRHTIRNKWLIIYAVFMTIMFALSASKCDAAEYSVELALGVNVSEYAVWAPKGDNGGFAGPLDTARASIRADFKNDIFVQFSHTSHLSDGFSAGGNTADWLDVIEMGVKFKL